MKPRNTKDLRTLSADELKQMITDNQDALAKQKFQLALKQLHDTTYLRIIRRDVARMKTILNEKMTGIN